MVHNIKKIIKKILPYLIFLLLPTNCFAFSAGLVSDIHAGGNKDQTTRGITIYPKKALRELKRSVTEMEKAGVDVIIATGDLTNRGERKYAKQLKKIQGVLWVKGNHDGKSFDMLAERYYFRDYGDYRIIILDSSVLFPKGTGGLDQSQIEFLKQAENTEKKVIIVMHHPIFYQDSFQYLEAYQDFRDALTPNVKMIASGHWHLGWERQQDGILFEGVPAITNGGYKIISVD